MGQAPPGRSIQRKHAQPATFAFLERGDPARGAARARIALPGCGADGLTSGCAARAPGASWLFEARYINSFGGICRRTPAN
jgi:hypothetical protein